MTPAPVRTIEQKCRSEKCGKWFSVARLFVQKLETDWKQGVTFNRVVLCTHCFTEQMLLPIGSADAPETPRERCKVQYIVLHTIESLREIEGETQTKGANRASLVERRNDLLRERGAPVPVPTEAQPTRKELAAVIHEIENPPDAEKPEMITPTTRGELLKRLNVVRVKQGKKALKKWGLTHDELITAVDAAEADRSHVEVTVEKPKIAKGANTSRFKTEMHKNKLLPQVKKQSREDHKAKLAAEKPAKPVVEHVAGKADAFKVKAGKAKPLDALNTGRKPVADAGKAKPAKAAPKKAGKAKADAEHVTPARIAELLEIDPRAVRGTLRKIESKIPKDWRVEGVRWGFKDETKIAKFVKDNMK